MKKISCFFPFVVLFGIGNICYAQTADYEKPTENKFSLIGQIRPRAEFRAGTFRPLQSGEDPASLVTNRIRLNIDYSYKDLLSTKVSLQNVNIWGQANAVQVADYSGNTLSVFEAWADIKLGSHLHTRIGRQAIALDDERIFGVVDWAQSARSHDALSVYFVKGKLEVRSYFAYNQNYKELGYNNNINNPTGNNYSTKDAQPYQHMQTLWAQIPATKNASVSLLFSNLGFHNASSPTDSSNVNNQQTMGANYFYGSKRLKGNLSAYYQTGHGIASIHTSAFLLAGSIGANFTKQWFLSLNTDYLSGNDFGKPSTENRAFSPSLATNHKFYGSMDYFFAGTSHGNVGLMDNYLRLKYTPVEKTSFQLTGHLFRATADIYKGGNEINTNLGQELDLDFIYKVNKFVDIQGGYSGYFVTDALRLVKATPAGEPYQQWVWLSLNVHPELLRMKF